MPRKNDDAWMQSLDEYKVLQTYESQKKQGKNAFEKAERTVRGDWKPRQKGRGDWICPRHECGNINFGYRDECNLCSEPRPKSTFFNIKGRFVRPSDTGGEIGEEASTKSGGLFSADDWICRCGNINWAKRNACHECGRSRVELAPRLGSRMADSEGKAIKNELLSRAGDEDINQLAPEEFARVGRGRFAKTDPNAIYGGGSMAGSDRLAIPDAHETRKFNQMMSKSRGSRGGEKMPGFHGLRYPGWEEEEEDFGEQAKREVDEEDEILGKSQIDENTKMRDALTRAQREEELKELKYKAERKAAAMGILWYESWEDPKIENLENEKNDLEKSNENYMGRALPERAARNYASESSDDEEEEQKKPWDFKIPLAKHQMTEKPEEVQEHEFFNLLDEKERKRLLEKKLEKNMKKIQKQLAKEKARNEEKKKDIDQKKIKKEERKAERERLIALGVISADSDVKTEPADADEAAPMAVDDSSDAKDVKPKIKKEPESDDDDVDGVDMEDTQKLTSMRHQFIPGGLKEPEQREQVKIGLNFGGSKVIKRNNVKKAFTIKPKRKMFA